MLNISQMPADMKSRVEDSGSLRMLADQRKGYRIVRGLFIAFVIIILVLLLPWTQNVMSTGKIISRFPDKKPQQINTLIDGRIVSWYAYEGQFIEKGDTILILDEVKPEYLDPRLVERTQNLINAKTLSIAAYERKIAALLDQETALVMSRDFELSQARLKVLQARQYVQADSAALVQENLNIQIADERFRRAEELYRDGLLSTTDFESRDLSRQEAVAKQVKARNQLLGQRQSLEMALIEVNRKAAEFADKLAKNRSDIATTESATQEAIGEKTKLENSIANYQIREGGRIVLAP